MFRIAWVVTFSAFFLTTSIAGQVADHPVSAKVKEMFLIQRAEKGDTRAQVEITRKAENGDPQAQSALGDNYEYGIWVPKDHAQALRWHRKAAEQGDNSARTFFGDMYFDGNGVERDFAAAARWYGCPKPSDPILTSCEQIRYEDLPIEVHDLLSKANCEVRAGSNYDYGSAVDLSGNGIPAYQFCCSESPHGPCGAVVIGKVGAKWKNVTAKAGLFGFYGACGNFIVLESRHNGFQDVCLPYQCSAVTPRKANTCAPTIWQFGDGRYHSVAPKNSRAAHQ